MTKVFTCIIDGKRSFFKSVEELPHDLTWSQENARETVTIEGCECYVYSIVEDESTKESAGDLFEFDFDEDEPLSFMECDGPSAECCFIIKKSKIDFIKESSFYMNESINFGSEDGDQIVTTYEEDENCMKTIVTYCYENGEPTDLMSFTFIELKW